MRRPLSLHTLCSLALGTCTVFALSSCVDDSYDFKKNIDLTVGIGGEGLGWRMSDTKPIELSSLLDVDETVRLEDGTNRYYMVEKSSTNLSFNVENVSSEVSNTIINTNYRVLPYSKARTQYIEQYGNSLEEDAPIPVPAGFYPAGRAEGNDRVEFTVEKVDPAVVSLSSVRIKPVVVSVYIRSDYSDGTQFDLKRVRNVVVDLPSIFHISKTTLGSVSGHRLTINSVDIPSDGKLTEVTIDAIDFNASLKPNAKHELVISEEKTAVSLTADVDFYANRAFEMKKGDYADVKFDLVVNGKADGNKTTVQVTEATGKFNPDVTPSVEPIEVGSTLPDFLRDDDVRMPVTNTTLRLTADLTSLPVDFNFSGKLSAVNESGTTISSVELPTSGSARITSGKDNNVYFYQGNSPYDPERSASEATATYEVPTLGKLIEKIPDHIDIDQSGGRVTLPQDKDYTITIGKEYAADADYCVFVPFEFRDGLTIVYNDTTKSLNSDFRDYSAEGIQLKASVENTIPLDLVGTLTAIDTGGNVLDCVKFDEINIAAGDGSDTPKMTDISVRALLDNADDLKRVDRIVFSIRAASGESTATHSLVSTQYLRFTDIRMHLLGRIVVNFN